MDEWDAKYGREEKQLSYVQGDIESFVSPIDGRVISDRKHLREHNKEHGVTNPQDYSDDFFKKAQAKRQNEMQGTTAKAKQERIAELKYQMSRHEGR